MELTSRKIIKDIFKRYGLKPAKRFGQNFLVDKKAVRQIVEAAQLTDQDTVLEIGPGLGVITQELAQRAKKIIAVEKDQKMVEILKETLRDYNNIEIINADIRMLNEGCSTSFKIVGNLPFYLTAPVIRQFLEAENQPEFMALIVQKEVGQRICAKPPEMNLLAVSVQIYAEPKILAYIPRGSFWPEPKVNAALIKITPRAKPLLIKKEIINFFKIVKAGFSQPRKQLLNNFSKNLMLNKQQNSEWLSQNGIAPERRAETLSVGDWINLTKSFIIN